MINCEAGGSEVGRIGAGRREFFMKEALKEAEKAFEADEVPVGAVIVYQKKIIARAHNQMRTLKDPTAHAEMIAITQASHFLRNERLNDCDFYVTIEPCPMCMGASVLARARNLIYGAKDPKSGACGSVMKIGMDNKLNHKITVRGGLLKDRCASLMTDFFNKKRREKSKWNPLSEGGLREKI